MKKLLLLCSVLFTLIGLHAQNVEVTGTVRDAETKEVLQSASIKYEKGKVAITDASGKFHFSAPPGQYFLNISYIGYKSHKDTIEITADGKLNLDFVLKSAAIQVSQVVTVSAYKKNAATETVTTEVITKNQIQNTNSNDLGEIVNKTPGVLVQDGQISIRGGSSYSYGIGTRTAILSDGLALTSADLGEGQSKMAGVENVKQVEVIKGASSVIYGSSALNGVVNVISEWPSASEPKTEISTSISVTDRPNLAYQQWWKSPPLGVIVNVNHQQRIKNLQLVIAGNLTGIKSYLKENDEFRMRISFKTRYLHPKIQGLNFGVNGSVMYERSERFYISQNLDSFIMYRKVGADDRYVRTNIDPFVSYTNAKGHRINATYRYMNIFRQGNRPDPDAISHQLMADNQYQYRWKNILVLTTGIPFNFGYSSSNLYKGLQKTFGVAAYAQLEFNYKILSLQGGVRYEVLGVDTNIETGRPIFRSGINIQAGKASFIRASFGQGYRIPSVGERYIAQPFTEGMLIIPNDTLKPESGWGLELGFKQGFKIGKNWSAYFDVALFWQQYKQFVEYSIGQFPNRWSNGTPIFPTSMEFFGGTVLGLRASNIENARIAGYEVGLAGIGKIGPVGLQILAGYTYTWPGKVDSTYAVGDFVSDMFKYNFQRVTNEDTMKLLNYRIRHLFRADIEITYWKCYLGATFNYGSSPEALPGTFRFAFKVLFKDANALDRFQAQHLGGDFFMDIRAGIKINDHVKLGFIVKNLTNRVYALRPGKIEPLRNYTLQFRYTF